MELLRWLFDAQLHIGDSFVLWREVLGNVFGLLSALGGMRRKLWAWPVGIIGNLLLLTVFLGVVFGSPNPVNLLGQVGRQVMFIAVAVYGWLRWRQSRGDAGAAVTPRWATPKERILLIGLLVLGTAALTPVFRALGSYEPVWADAWIFVGSVLATWGMAREWTEFWLVWVAVDIVGVPLLLSAGYWASAAMYVFYGAFTLTGFFIWWRVQRVDGARAAATPDGAPRTGSVVSVETAFPDVSVSVTPARPGAVDPVAGTSDGGRP
ncbi:nicotinamide mononucleotide transporter [Kocuria sp. JC486]|uniref:Nicotinamide riboside transporter PnuC n=1 Tax=Kocuria soli TaxID=2485125 RepID=A0A3N3ZY50_9MICC|nr:nicotinamide riboside transporter PnuC [Kocuria soli]NHU84334.1 nicotinamide mononucleotide transporter [Kocuria sp. JC486]ROZ63699.1 nicotinamide riboside transporter PnuC [Kocuria soli]